MFSPDGSKVVYRAKQGGKEFIVVNDQRGPEFNNVGSPVFSPDGEKMAYVAKQGSKEFIVFNNKRKMIDTVIWRYVFSQRASNMFYEIRQVSKGIILVGEKGPDFDRVWPPIFSSDGSKLAYGAHRGKELWWKVMNVR